MPVPTSINDLSTTAASNGPSGSDAPNVLDDHLRALASFVALLRNSTLSGTDGISTTTLAFTGAVTGGTAAINIGSGQFYKSTAGNVGIGTASPTSNGSTYRNLELRGTSGGGGFLYSGDTAAKSRFGYGAASGGTVVESIGTDPIVILVNGTEEARITSTGLGLGTTSPAATLHVSGSVRLDVTTDTSATAGAASALPATPAGYMAVSISGTTYKVPYYAS